MFLIYLFLLQKMCTKMRYNIKTNSKKLKSYIIQLPNQSSNLSTSDEINPSKSIGLILQVTMSILQIKMDISPSQTIKESVNTA